MNDHPLILIVEDDFDLREALVETVRMAGFATVAAADGKAALALLQSEDIALVVSDIRMDGMDGESLLRRIHARTPQLPVILMTAYATIERAVRVMREGAVDYLVKPFEGDTLIATLRRYLPATASGDNGLIAVDTVTRELAELACRVAASEVTVMITGESGTGKEVLARYIHSHSPRREQPFIAINCAAIPENMLEATLFGYEKGAFTGAYQSRVGKFEQAEGGVLLLDEISEMDLGLQAKLLRVLQEREVERLGGRQPIALDVRVLATSNRNLREEVAAGRFREDLFYRLNVFPLHVPPLRERPADVAALAQALIAKHAGTRRVSLTAAAMARLSAYPWPGNVRELDNVLQRALIFASGEQVQADAIHLESGSYASRELPMPAHVGPASVLGNGLRCRENELILDALRADRGSRKAAAERLGISPRTLRYKLARLREAGVAIPG